ncbi:helix-turn-helix transcriptional regulator [Mycobacterium sp. SM1]|uniref:helix-turn-helix domain-containing protein n=1 Tax=Mycobacterium sp. SM1 TaxID=2816243 RepID=UPI001BCC3F2F|nr:AraC family transcriptional regulator [Mycobacterium sp. SM1]MBS4727458.1 helix-turn-helix transcriptional regulator [Mycobacterium sp. SM1]
MPPPLIVPEQVPLWVPGQLTVRSPTIWRGLSVRGYRYRSSDVEVPPLRDFLIVAYLRGSTAMRRRVDGAWVNETLRPGDVSLLTRAAASHWIWPNDIEVVHVYLTRDELAATCRQMYERDVEEVELRDEVRADDPAIHHVSVALANEATHGGVGDQLLVDSLSVQLCVHILRRHADVIFRDAAGHDGLTFAQQRTVYDYIQEHLSEAITLDDLAASVALSRYHFARRFRQSTGTSPHDFVLRQRVERAKILLARTGDPLAHIATRCGFADQSHLTRVFSKYVSVTPGRYRATCGNVLNPDCTTPAS